MEKTSMGVRAAPLTLSAPSRLMRMKIYGIASSATSTIVRSATIPMVKTLIITSLARLLMASLRSSRRIQKDGFVVQDSSLFVPKAAKPILMLTMSFIMMGFVISIFAKLVRQHLELDLKT